MELNERISLARKRAGLSQEQLGDKLGVSRQAVSKWESGQTNPDIAYVAEMCRLFGVSSDWLLLGEEIDQETTPARCPKCQAVVTGLDNFCPSCGQPLTKDAKQLSDTYTVVLDISRGTYTELANDLVSLSNSGQFSGDSPLASPITRAQARELIVSTPCVLGRGLSAKYAATLKGRMCFRVYRDSDGDTPEELLTKEEMIPKSPAEPLTFGAVVGAVIVGVVCAVLLLSFL